MLYFKLLVMSAYLSAQNRQASAFNIMTLEWAQPFMSVCEGVLPNFNGDVALPRIPQLRKISINSLLSEEILDISSKLVELA